MILLTAPSEGEKRPLLYEPGYVARIFQPSYVNVKKNSLCLIQLTRTSVADERTVPRLICKTLCETPPGPPPLRHQSAKEKKLKFQVGIFWSRFSECCFAVKEELHQMDVCDFYFMLVKSRDKGSEPPVCCLKTYTPT